jgi:uncharacterized iron-regulated protein
MFYPKRLFFIIFCFFMMHDLNAQNAYKIYSNAEKREIKLDEIPTLLKNMDVIFWGEEHNDSIGHDLENQLYQLLNSKQPYALGMEMFESDIQEVVDEYLNDLIRPDYLISAGRAWPNYTDYQPLVEYVKAHRLPVIATNAPKRYVSAVTKNGLTFLPKFNSLALSYLAPLPIHVDTGAYQHKFENIMGGHEALAASHIFESQNLWDATMAWHIAKFLQKDPNSKIFHLNGGFHSDEKLGIYTQLESYLQRLKITKQIANISCSADANWNNPDWQTYLDRGDIIILTQPKS